MSFLVVRVCPVGGGGGAGGGGGGGVSAVEPAPDVSAVRQPVLYELDVLQVVLDHADQVAQALLLLLQVLREDRVRDSGLGSEG